MICLPSTVNRFAEAGTMPRRYTLGRREAPKAETRARIVDAAVEIFRERGMSAASNLAVAKAADVAPATVRNHFPGPRDLSDAVFEQVLGRLAPPTPAILEGVDGLPARVSRLATELADFYARSDVWWRAYQREPELIDAWAGGVDRYYRDIDALMRAALGDLGDDAEALAVVAAVIGPPTFFALQARGASAAEAVKLTIELVVPWLEARGRANGRRGRRRRT
jgi:AcrR family transcriptional regulator